jgi:hypothetical protein
VLALVIEKQPTKNTVASAERDEQVIGPIGLCAGISWLPKLGHFKEELGFEKSRRRPPGPEEPSWGLALSTAPNRDL